jgi:hypothetical protein
MKVSLFKIGIILSVIGMIWISVVFLERDKISEDFLLESSSSHSIKLDFVGKDIGYYKILMPEFSGEEIFIQVLDYNKNIISEQSVHTKMSVGYFDFEKSGKYLVNIANISKNSINMQIEFGNTNSQNMIPSGIMIVVGAVMIILASYMKLKNYRIEQPDENIS